MLDIRGNIHRYIEENFSFRTGWEHIGDTDSLLEGGVIDSASVLSLVIFLEETFAISVADEDVVPDNLDSITKISDYVRRKLGRERDEVAAP